MFDCVANCNSNSAVTVSDAIITVNNEIIYLECMMWLEKRLGYEENVDSFGFKQKLKLNLF